jgi:hypothetical protein
MPTEGMTEGRRKWKAKQITILHQSWGVRLTVRRLGH